MRRVLVTAATVSALLWAVSGVSVLAAILHEHHHHGDADHNHNEGFELFLQCHDDDETPHHDHELTAALTVVRAKTSVGGQVGVALPNDFDNVILVSSNALIGNLPMVRDLGPPSYLLHCVSLT